jgi:hypothetical protein
MPASTSAVATAAPPQTETGRPATLGSRWKIAAVICLIIGIVGGFVIGRHDGFNQGAALRRELPSGSVLCRPGPWGDLSYTSFIIAAPDSVLPVDSMESAGTRWFFKAYTAATFSALLQSTTLTPDQQRALLDPAVMHAQPDGVILTPTPDEIFSLTDDARGVLYQTLAQFPENETQFRYIRQDTLADRFAPDSGVSASTVALFKSLCYARDNYFILSGIPALLSRVPSQGEKLAVLKALSQERTMLLRLRVTPGSDVPALTGYWGKGVWNTDVQTILQSLTNVENGSWISILMVLPPLPTEQIYDYPAADDSTADALPVSRGATWTALNFFHDTPDPSFADPKGVLLELRSKYFPATGDPRYGDLVIFSKADGTLVHMAVYIADDICFTKNGSTALDPWLLKSTQELTERYSCQLQPGEQLSVSYYRSKYM